MDFISVTTEDDENYAIQFNYEFLDDIYMIPSDIDKGIDSKKKKFGNYFRFCKNIFLWETLKFD